MTVCIFPGQGSQFVGMGEDLFGRFADETSLADDILGYSIAELCLSDPDRKLRNTRFTQPAVFMINALSWRRWREDTGLVPAFFMGHSLGEYSALEAAGMISFEDALRLVQKRGALMSEAPAGAMAAVLGMTEDRIRDTLAANGLEAIDVANLNADGQTIVSGLSDDIARAASVFESDTVRYIPLNTGGAFHSRYMEEARSAFAEFVRGFAFAQPSSPVISNLRAEPYDASLAAEMLIDQITHPVQWARSVRYVLAHGETDFEELGPGQVLTKLVAEIKRSAPPPGLSRSPAPDADPVPADEEPADVWSLTEAWNRSHPPGTRISVPGYDGPLVTRTRATVLFGHRAAVYVEGYNGYFDLAEVRPA